MINSIISRFFVLSLSTILIMNACRPASTPAAGEPIQASLPPQAANSPEASAPLPTDVPYTIAEVEALAGFDVKEPAYLPKGVSFDFATYQERPQPKVTLHFKMIHETYGDMGAFFQIVQEPQPQASPNPTACGVSANDCETIQIDDMLLKYRLSTPTESLMWDTDGFSFQLFRTAGEPEKVYKDELLKVVGSMK